MLQMFVSGRSIIKMAVVTISHKHSASSDLDLPRNLVKEPPASLMIEGATLYHRMMSFEASEEKAY